MHASSRQPALPLLRDGGVCAVLGAMALTCLGIDLRAAFPYGDGGLFYAIIAKLLAGGFAYPASISYNGTAIPFGYSPLTFYAVAVLARLLSLPIGSAMNLWVGVCVAMFGPAAYWSARQFLRTWDAAAVAAAALVLCSHYTVYLGMGGGVTRAPGFLFFMLSCGAFRRLASVPSSRNTALACACTGVLALVHMEFFLLGVASVGVIAAMHRMPARTLLICSAAVFVTVLPWPLMVLLHSGATPFVAALHTAHGSRPPDMPAEYANIFGLAPNPNLIGLLGFIAAGLACMRRRPMWLIWAVVIVAVDTRAGRQAVHLPLALAIGACYMTAVRAQPARLVAAFAVAAVATSSLVSANAAAQRVVRLTSGDVADMQWLSSHTPRNAAVIAAYSGDVETPFLDQTYEWLPVFSNRYSPTAFEGLEWIRGPGYVRLSANLAYIQGHCGYIGPSCYLRFARLRLPRRTPLFVYVPNHSAHADAATQLFAGNHCFRRVHASAWGNIFHVCARTRLAVGV